MKIDRIQVEGDQVVLKVVGRITQNGMSDGSDPLEPFLDVEGQGCTLRLDLSGTEFIDSSGIGWLIQSHKRLRAAGGNLILHAPSPPIERSFEVVKLGNVIQIDSTRA